MADYNVALRHWLDHSLENKGDEGSIERTDKVENVRWQTRAAVPTDYENALGDALQEIFAEEVYDLPGILSRLNERGVRAPNGAPWTEESFTAEMARLGA